VLKFELSAHLWRDIRIERLTTRPVALIKAFDVASIAA
jgi:hypothetical protein